MLSFGGWLVGGGTANEETYEGREMARVFSCRASQVWHLLRQKKTGVARGPMV